MSIRIPKNRIKENQYTIGDKFIDESTNQVYKGYYYELNGSAYIGKTYDAKAKKLTPIKKANTLLNKGRSLAVFSLLTGITSQALSAAKIPSVSTLKDTKSKNFDTLTFYYKKINEQPIVIKEIDETTYKSLQNNPIYQTTFVGTYQNKTQTVDDAEKQVQGIKAFLGL